MSVLYTLLEQARATRARLEEKEAQQVVLTSGAKEMLAARLERRIAAHKEDGDEQGFAEFLARLQRKLLEMREGAS